MVGPPELRYAMNGPWRLAYQVLGEGPDLMYIPGWVNNVEANWLVPDHARFIEGLASFARTIVVDRRGTGCSDRLPPGEASTLEEGVEDLRFVSRAAQSPRPAVFGVQDGGFFALLAAATHPERFTKLILFGAAHMWQRTDETPWQWSEDQFEDTEAAFSGPALTDAAEGYIGLLDIIKIGLDRAHQLVRAFGEVPLPLSAGEVPSGDRARVFFPRAERDVPHEPEAAAIGDEDPATVG